MSRIVIHDIVIPIIEKIIQHEGYYTSYGSPIIQDPNLEEFLEEELRRRFGVIGANECQHLKEQLEQAKENDPYAFEFLLRELLNKYIKLIVKIRHAKKLKELDNGPPDRFSELRKKYKLLGYHR